ncbi:hypothetical protein KEM56_007704 [Ascosphaera pollenicola]|nr:hypothetical protein KEM56_007704 [Ascosphaera pollenicola]
MTAIKAEEALHEAPYPATADVLLTPRKRGANPDSSNESPRKKHASPSKKSSAPTCLAQASPEDQMIFRSKNEGKSWPEIAHLWELMTGDAVSSNLVRKRYDRMKANFAVFEEEDVPRLLEACRVVEEEIERAKAEVERERFSRIAQAITAAGGGSYTAAVIQKKMREVQH